MDASRRQGGRHYNLPLVPRKSQRGRWRSSVAGVLVPYGGHNGDCGDYRGWVVSVSPRDPAQLSFFTTRALGAHLAHERRRLTTVSVGTSRPATPWGPMAIPRPTGSVQRW